MKDIIASMQNQIHSIHNDIQNAKFLVFWRGIANHLDSFLSSWIANNVQSTKLNVSQIKLDITEMIKTIFSEYTKKPENFFSKTIKLLNKL